MGNGVGNWDQREECRMMKSMTECARSAVMLNGEISNHADILKGVKCTLSPDSFKAYINDTMIAV